jgi:hypothetical protein
MTRQTITIDWEAVQCDWRHMTASGKGWARRIRELGGDAGEAAQLRERLQKGMAAEIELSRIYRIAGR